MTRSAAPDDLHVDPARGGWVRLYDARGRTPMRLAHRHVELEANIVVSGTAEYLIDDRRVRFPRHALGWLLPHQNHRLIQRAPDLRMWIAVFTPALLTELNEDGAATPSAWVRSEPDDGHVRAEPDVRQVGTEPDEGQVRVVDQDIGDLDRICGRIADPATPVVRHRVGLSWLLSECWRAYRSATGTPAEARLHPAVQAAARWLHDHASDPEADDLSALARRCGISRPWLSRLFREQLGESLTDYRNRQRFYRFRDLLSRSDIGSYTTAAIAAGFGSYTQCFRVVRQHAGRSPRDLARQLREL